MSATIIIPQGSYKFLKTQLVFFIFSWHIDGSELKNTVFEDPEMKSQLSRSIFGWLENKCPPCKTEMIIPTL